MSSGVKDIQLYELKDTILQLNKTISDQNKLIESLQKMLEDRNASEAKKGSADSKSGSVFVQTLVQVGDRTFASKPVYVWNTKTKGYVAK